MRITFVYMCILRSESPLVRLHHFPIDVAKGNNHVFIIGNLAIMNGWQVPRVRQTITIEPYHFQGCVRAGRI